MEEIYTWFVKQEPSPTFAPEDGDRSPSRSSGAGDRSAPALWVPLRRRDQKSLEAALLAAEVGLGDVDNVPVDGGRAEVQIEERCYVDRFGVVPPPPSKPVRRVLWLRHTGGIDGTWQPYSEQMDQAIEFAYKLLIESAGNSAEAEVQATHFARDVPLSDGGSSVHLQFDLKVDEATGARQWSMLAEERLSSDESPRKEQSSGAFAWLQELAIGRVASAATPVKRGYGEVPLTDGCIEEELLGEEISRLVIFVHGISCEERDHDAGRVFRRNLHRSQLQAMGIEEDDFGIWGPVDKMPLGQQQPKTELMEVFWDQNTQQTKDRVGTFHDQLERTSLPSMSRVRELMNRTTHGFVLYIRHREEIMAAVRETVEAALWRFHSANPGFDGEILMVGHLLGAVALFELLSKEQLPCQASALFALGAPIGQLLELEGDLPLIESRFQSGTRFFNVYHPLDLVACRTEPLLMPELATRSPAKVPTERVLENGANLQQLQAFISKSKKDANDDNISENGSVFSSTRASSVDGNEDQRAVRLAELIALRLHGRLDWVLQSESGCEEGASSDDLPDAARTSHQTYLRSFDVAAFIHASSIQLLQPAEPDRPVPEKAIEAKTSIFGQADWQQGFSQFLERKSFWERASTSSAALGLKMKNLAESARGEGQSSGEKDSTSESHSPTHRPSGGLWGSARAVYAAAKLRASVSSPESQEKVPS